MAIYGRQQAAPPSVLHPPASALAGMADLLGDGH